jgi:FkbM family methyltransferase
MKSFITSTLVRNFPYLGTYKRKLAAFIDSSTPVKSSYSQYGEDVYLYEQIRKYDLNHSIFVDVGSNHPTSLSNTYLFYRQGLNGIAIDANSDLIRLHRRFRPRDIAICLGCSNKSSLGRFEVAKTPVLSRFQGSESPGNLGFEQWHLEFVPILPVDVAIKAIDFEWIFLLSIDVEGLDYEVLEGAKNTLEEVLFCCVEANNDSHAQRIGSLMQAIGFFLEKQIECNLIYRNSASKFEAYKRER